MSTAVIAQKAPYAVDVTKGERYFGNYILDTTLARVGHENGHYGRFSSTKGNGVNALGLPLKLSRHRWCQVCNCRYFWCACGRSDSQPFCDGSHKDTGIAPLPWTADQDKTLFFCGCKRSGGTPLCDGAHAKL